MSVNTLCQDDKYTVTVIFGTQPTGTENCAFQSSNITISNVKPSLDVRVDVPEDIVGHTGEEYCYLALLHVA